MRDPRLPSPAKSVAKSDVSIRTQNRGTATDASPPGGIHQQLEKMFTFAILDRGDYGHRSLPSAWLVCILLDER